MYQSDPCSSSPTPWVQVQSCLLSSFYLPSFILLSFPWIYNSFLVVRGSCQLLAGVPQDLLYLNVFSWCISGERCTPCPPTLLLSCLLSVLSLDIIGLPTFIIFRIVWPILSSWHFHRNFRVRCTPFTSLVVSGFFFRAAVCCVRVKSSCMGGVFEFNSSSDHWTSLCSWLLVCFVFLFFLLLPFLLVLFFLWLFYRISTIIFWPKKK